MRNTDFVDVYIYRKGFSHGKAEIVEWRQKEIEADWVGDKYWTWRLLEKAIKRSLNLELNDLHPHRIETQRLVIDNFFVSMSNSGDYVMVAVSSKQVGVDIQCVRDNSHSYYDSNTWTDNERLYLSKDKPWKNYKYWSRKEALYKYLDPGYPYNDETHKLLDTTKFEHLFIDGRIEAEDEYYWSVASSLFIEGVEPKIMHWPNDRHDY